MVNSNFNQERYVMFEGKLVPKTILKEKKGLMQGGQQEIQYELDNEKICNLMLEFGGLLDGSNDLSSSTEEPLYTPQQRVLPPEPLDTPQPYQQPIPGGVDWISVCSNLQVALISSCDVLVNQDNTLTTEGQRAVDCIRNGILLAGGGSFLANLPISLVITALQALEEPIGCGGVVNWGSIGNVGDLQGIISLLT
jgi:hypothetical protein